MTVNQVYPSILDTLLEGAVNLTTVGLRIILIDDTYVYDPTDVTMVDIPAGVRISAITTLAGTITATGGVLSTDTETTTIPTVPVNADDVGAVILCTTGAADINRLLIAAYFKQSDTTPIVVVTDDTDVTVTFPDGRLLRI